MIGSISYKYRVGNYNGSPVLGKSPAFFGGQMCYLSMAVMLSSQMSTGLKHRP